MASHLVRGGTRAVRQQHAIFILAAAMALAPTLPVSGHQEPQPDPAESIAVRLRPDTLALFINDGAGVRVRLVNGVVKGIASTRVFTVRMSGVRGILVDPAKS